MNECPIIIRFTGRDGVAMVFCIPSEIVTIESYIDTDKGPTLQISLKNGTNHLLRYHTRTGMKEAMEQLYKEIFPEAQQKIWKGEKKARVLELVKQ